MISILLFVSLNSELYFLNQINYSVLHAVIYCISISSFLCAFLYFYFLCYFVLFFYFVYLNFIYWISLVCISFHKRLGRNQGDMRYISLMLAFLFTYPLYYLPQPFTVHSRELLLLIMYKHLKISYFQLHLRIIYMYVCVFLSPYFLPFISQPFCFSIIYSSLAVQIFSCHPLHFIIHVHIHFTFHFQKEMYANKWLGEI